MGRINRRPKKKPPKNKKPGWLRRFLHALRNTANVTVACESAGISRKRAYEVRKDRVAFRQAWEEAIQAATDDVAMSLRTIALSGNVAAALAILRAHRPEMWTAAASEERGQSAVLQQNNVTNVQVIGNHKPEELLAFIDASRHLLESGPPADAGNSIIPITWEDKG